MSEYGLVLTGTLRGVRQQGYDVDGERRSQTVLVIDSGGDYLDQVVVPSDQAARVRADLDGRKGDELRLSVFVGNYRKLWLREVL